MILLIALFTIIQAATLPSWIPFSVDRFQKHETLAVINSKEGMSKSVEMFWSIDLADQSIELGIASNLGSTWLALGTSDAGGMLGANIWLGRTEPAINNATNTNFILDERFTPIYGPPKLMKNQTVKLLTWVQTSNVTAFTFKRPLKSCGVNHASLSLKKPIWFIWAIGESNTFSKHRDDRRGQALIDLEGNYFKNEPEIVYDEKTSIYSMVMPPIHLKSNESTTYCYSYYDLSALPDTHYIIAENFTVGSKYTHHVLTYACNKPLQQFSNPGTVLCNNYRRKGQEDYIEFKNSCAPRPYIAWGRGQKPRTYPADFGKPVGPGPLNVQYLVMEVHFSNTNHDEGAFDSGTGFLLTLTSKPQSKQIGMLTVGKNILSMELQPGGTPSSINECGSACTSRMQSAGLTPLSAILHMHKRGSSIKVRHVRGIQELEPFPSAEYFDFNFQTPSYVSRTQSKIMPGDRIIVNCTYDTTKDTLPVLGGYSSEEEMCFAFIEYWPAIDIGNCISFFGPKMPEINYCPKGKNDITPMFPYIRLPFTPWTDPDQKKTCLI